LYASEKTSEFERLATDYNTGSVKREFGAVHDSMASSEESVSDS
jgi:hypothetical protein